MRRRKPKLNVVHGGWTGARDRSAKRVMPTCPAHLSPSAKSEWKRLTRQLFDMGVVTVLDRAVMAAYCQSYGRWVEAERKLKEMPPLLKTPAGYVQQNPWLTISNKQLELMHKYLSELGLSPVSRARIELRVPGLRNPFEELMGVRKPWEA